MERNDSTSDRGELPKEQNLRFDIQTEAGEPVSRERLTEVRLALAQLGLRLVSSDELSGEVAKIKEENEPVFATRDSFVQFARNHGYTDQRAYKAWMSVIRTAGWQSNRDPEWRRPDPFPPITVTDPDSVYETHALSRPVDKRIIDLRSIHQRLVASDMNRLAWDDLTDAGVAFLARLTNEEVQPDDLLQY
ncbi:hypothetical protein ACWC4E_33895 [Streptomyces sp. NPDC001273]|uniref:hypothetical protein n=1 Tax=unclassified Streptomyces TaxID=2593676 RepID=UPI0033D3CFD6